jgi:hypothetical protein
MEPDRHLSAYRGAPEDPLELGVEQGPEPLTDLLPAGAPLELHDGSLLSPGAPVRRCTGAWAAAFR